jgi:hypothetical protein
MRGLCVEHVNAIISEGPTTVNYGKLETHMKIL